jgi:uncharacterized protein YjgD (DUF1641 family)
VSSLDDIAPAQLAEADPEAVAAALERSGQAAAVRDALAPDGEPTAVREAVAANDADLEAAIEQVVAMQRSGTLDRMVEVADAVTLLTSVMDDETIETLARTGSSLGEVADTAGRDEVRSGLIRTLEGVGRASGPDADTAPVGAVGLLRALRDPEVRAGMGHLVAVARGIGAAAPGVDAGRDA